MIHQTALVIDDDPLFRLVAEELLLACGVGSVTAAEDGRLGLQALIEAPQGYDLVICDLQMPDIDGVGVIRELGNLEFSGTVIIASGEDANLIRAVHDMAQMVGVRIAGALKKPLDVEALRTLLGPVRLLEQVGEQMPLSREEIEAAIARRIIVPHYQPQIDVRTQRICGFEVLARIRGENGVVLSAADHLVAAEYFGLMTEFTLLIVDQVLADLPPLLDKIGPFKLAFNLSPTSLQDVGLPKMLVDRFLAAGIAPSMITLEVTEDRLLERKADVLEVLSRLRLAGFRLSIDDFGTGATSIEQLRLFPFTELKIDRQFVQSAPQDEFSRLTLESGISLATLLGMTVVAEGVETVESLLFAQSAGAHEVQGFYFSKALAASQILSWTSTYEEKRTRSA
jgi:EAL domain-containing protein (putative c-di-GMP-specific phosphodiesterase class I)/CheY-like chemotaxis protein